MNLVVVPIYAALLAILFVVLSIRAIGARRIAKVAVGPLGREALDRRLRVHANCAEYAPFALLLLALAEARGAPGFALHAGAAVLVLGRLSHAWGMSRVPENFGFRVAGMGMTFAAYAFAFVAIAVTYL
ncbi:MAG: MAPEG family protein [Rhodospirillales bacterium]|jgi:uncharacterized membrane protein YecN with MAPEG domain